MRYTTPLFGLVGAAAGLVVAATGYHLAAAPVAPSPTASEALAAVGRPLPAPPPQVRTRYLPCSAPAELHHGVCVTQQWRTTVVYDEPAPAPAPAPAVAPAAAPAPRPDAEHVDQDHHHEAQDDGEHGEHHEHDEPGEDD